MLSTIALVVAALSTSHKIGLAVVGASFIVFALICSFALPRRSPNFPGKHMALFVTACVVFFLAMLSAVIIFGREAPEAKGSEGTTPAETAPATTTTATAPTTTSSGGFTHADPVAGKAVFTSAGCAGCHTLKAAGATGNVGPNLDQLKPPEDRIRTQVENGGGVMPAFKGQLTQKQIDDVAAFVFVSTHA